MGDETVQPTVTVVSHAHIVSNSSSRDSFVGLAGSANDAIGEWNINTNTTMTEPPRQPDTHIITSQSSTPSLTPAMPTTFPSTLIVSRNPLPILPSAGLAVAAAPTNNTVPEFLFQLTKMLTSAHNDIIEWSNGRIEVHNPHKLESTVLQKFFRHSKFASFQRQLNYFGFRKLAGKGKMAPCSYVNEAATQDIGSLLLIKRKTTTTPKDKNGRKHAADKHGGKAVHIPLNTAKGVVHQVRPVATPAGHRPTASFDSQRAAPANTQQAIAQAAVGRGIRHSIGFGAAAAPAATDTQATANAPDQQTSKFLIPMRVEDSLSQLANNYQNSLVDLPSYPEQAVSSSQPASQGQPAAYPQEPFPSLLSRNSSLVDLAMIPTLEEGETDAMPIVPGMNFVDFPQPEVDPSKYRSDTAGQKEHQSG